MGFSAAYADRAAALSEADAHLGLANRMAVRFAKRVFLAYPLEGLEEPKYRVVGRPICHSSRVPSGRMRPPGMGPS